MAYHVAVSEFRKFVTEHWSASERGRYIQIRRATKPGSWLYGTFLALTALATDYPSAHPRIFFGFVTVILLKTLARIALVYTPRRIFLGRIAWKRALYFIVLATGFVWGAFLATTILVYGLSSDVTLLILICTIGTTTGAITAYSPAPLLLTTYLLGLLVPSMVTECLLANPFGKALAIITAVFLAFLIWQSRVLADLHRRRVISTSLISRRSKELAVQVAERTAELNAAKEAAELASRSKSSFLANVSHEIRTPMHGILGMTEIAMTNDNSAETAACLTDIKSSGESLLKIINDLLDLSRLEAFKLPIEIQPFSLRDCLDQCIRHLRIKAEQKSIRLTLSVARDVDDLVNGDALRVQQILTNLIQNAIKFTSSGEVWVLVSGNKPENPNLIRFAVEDTGCGIPLEKRAHIFEAFSQADDSTTRRFGGTGLGLAICENLARLMGGHIWVDGNKHGGSTFHLLLPRDPLSQAVPSEQTKERSARAGG
jgi:signal transduction histidine kinase